ncbi:hypothetical protein FRC07_008032, partial [Ceratobasidium sp. 392]
MTMLDPKPLLAISSLPALHRLTVLGFDVLNEEEPAALPVDSFPSLRELHLAGLQEDHTISVLSIPPLMSHLTHVELEHRVDVDDADEDDGQGAWIAFEILPLLKNSPLLRTFVLTVRSSKTREPYDIAYPELMETFSKLPLETISLTGVQLDDWGYDPKCLVTAWPNVTRVEMPDQFGGNLILQGFSQLPKLQWLKLSLYLRELEKPWPEVKSLSPLHTLESSEGGITVTRPEELEWTG